MKNRRTVQNKQIGNRAGEVLLLSPDIFRDARLNSSNSIQSQYFGMLKVGSIANLQTVEQTLCVFT